MTLTSYAVNSGRMKWANIEVNTEHFKLLNLLEEGLSVLHVPLRRRWTSSRS
ncbi:MAG: hypothetical protein IPK13_03345 [Deltaproteobacteria bacterium]|nr:hypothetical protein [Deltaproteobacteria bacterium]